MCLSAFSAGMREGEKWRKKEWKDEREASRKIE